MAIRGQFPPQFESDRTYKEEYNLEKLNVYLDADPGVYFDIKGLPDSLSLGKHYFTISFKDPYPTDTLSSPILKEGSSILFEFKDSEGHVIFSDLTRYDDISGAAIGYVWVKRDPLRTYNEISEGPATLTIVGQLQDDSVPQQFRDAYNVRTTIPLDIRKNQPNLSPVLFSASRNDMKTRMGVYEEVEGNADIIGPSGEVTHSNVTYCYARFNLSHLRTYGGQVTKADIYYKDSGSLMEDSEYHYLETVDLINTSSAAYEDGLVSGSAQGLNPMSASFRVLSPDRMDRPCTMKFKLKFTDTAGRTVQDFDRTGSAGQLQDFEITSSNITFAGAPWIISGDGNVIDGVINIGNVSGEGIQMAAGSAFIRSIGYPGFISASAGSGSGFLIYSGSGIMSGSQLDMLSDVVGTSEYAPGGVGLELHAGGPSGSLKFYARGENSEFEVQTPNFFLGEMANVDGQLIPQGTFISGSHGNLEISSSGFHLSSSGDVVLSGSITATDGDIGEWKIIDGKLSGSNATLDASSSALYMTSDPQNYFIDFTPQPDADEGIDASDNRAHYYVKFGDDFAVSSSGQLIASGAIIEGTLIADEGYIGGWLIDAGYMASVPDGLRLYGTASAQVGDQIYHISSSKFKVTTDGNITGSQVKFDGGGSIAGWNIDANNLFNSNVTISNAAGGQISLKDLDFGHSGIQLSASGEFHMGNGTDGIRLQDSSFSVSASKAVLSGSDIQLLTPSFLFGDSDNYISGSGGTIEISGSEIGVLTPSFLLGLSGSGAFVSGSDGNIEISASSFHLKGGNITASNADIKGTITAEGGVIGGFAITDSAITGSQFFISGGAVNSNVDNPINMFISTSKFNVKGGGDVTASAIRADSGHIGNIKLTSDKLEVPGVWQISSSQTPADMFISTSRFQVSNEGNITGSEVKFTGGTIAGWNIDDSGIYNANVSMSNADSRIQVFATRDSSVSESIRIGQVTNNKYGLYVFDLTGSDANSLIAKFGENGNEIAGWELTKTQLKGGNLRLDKSGIMETSDFASGVKGWRISAAGNGSAEFENVRIRGTLSTTVFEKETVNAVGGQLYVANSTALSESLSSTSTTMSVENASGFTGSYSTMPDGSPMGEVLSLKKVTAGGFSTEYCLVQSASLTTPTSADDFSGYLYVIRGYSGSNPVTGEDSSSLGDTGGVPQDYIEGQVVVSTGLSGSSGYIRMNANPNDPYSPYIDIVERTGSKIYDTDLKVRLGDLSGLSADRVFGSTSPGFGIWTENGFFTGGVTATTGSFTGIVHAGNVEIGKSISDVTTIVGSSLSNKDGLRLNEYNWWIDDGGTPKFRVGLQGEGISYDGSKFIVSSSTFHLGNAANFISSSDNTLKIKSDNVDISGSDVQIISPSFLFGISGSTHVSGADGRIEIKGNVTMSDNVQIDGALTIGNLPQIPSDDTLLGYWAFDETAGTDCIDNSSYNNTGSIKTTNPNGVLRVSGSNGSGYQSTGSISGNSLLFNSGSGGGNGGRVEITSSMISDEYLASGGDFSMTAWINPNTGSQEYDNIASRRSINPAAAGFQFDLRDVEGENDGKYPFALGFALSGSVNQTNQSTVTIPTGSWSHVAVTVDRDSGFKFYIDGEYDSAAGSKAINLTNQGADITGSSADRPIFTIGGKSSPAGLANDFHGYIDEVRVYSKVLTDLEVRALHNSPKGTGTTTIDGDSITTGEISSNDWEGKDSQKGSMFDLNTSQLHLGGSGSFGKLYFDGNNLKTSGSVTASSILVGKDDGFRLEYNNDVLNVSASSIFLGNKNTNFLSMSNHFELSASTIHIDSKGAGIFNLGNKLTWNGSALALDGTFTIGGSSDWSAMNDAISGSFNEASNSLVLTDQELALSASDATKLSAWVQNPFFAISNSTASFWTSAPNGEVASPQHMVMSSSAVHCFLSSSAGTGNTNTLVVTGSQNAVFGANPIPIDLEHVYYFKTRVRRVKPATINTPGVFYAGVACLDSNFSNIEGGSFTGGTYHYVMVSSENLPLGEWKTFTKTVSGSFTSGNDLSSFRAGTKYIRPQFLFNHNSSGDADSTMEVDYFFMQDLSSGQTVTTEYFNIEDSHSLALEITEVSESFSSSLSDISSSTALASSSAAQATFDAFAAQTTSSLGVPAAPSGQGLFMGSDRLGFYSGSEWYSYISGSGQFFFGSTASLDPGTTTPRDFIEFTGDTFKIKTRNITASGSNVAILSPSFLLGSNTAYISGSTDDNGVIEISSSKFHLQTDGDVVMNEITASNAKISGNITITNFDDYGSQISGAFDEASASFAESASQAAASASDAAYSQSLAALSASNAAYSSSQQAISSSDFHYYNNWVQNPYFNVDSNGSTTMSYWFNNHQSPKQFQTSSTPGQDCITNIAISGSEGIGGSNVVYISGSENWYYSTNPIPVDTSHNYYGEIRVKLEDAGTHGSWGGAESERTGSVYAGVACFDENMNHLNDGAGTERYFIVRNKRSTVEDGFVVYSGSITSQSGDSGDASPASEQHQTFHVGTKYVKPMFILNYKESGSTTAVDYFKFEDTSAGGGNPFIDDVSSSLATISESVTFQLDELEASSSLIFGQNIIYPDGVDIGGLGNIRIIINIDIHASASHCSESNNFMDTGDYQALQAVNADSIPRGEILLITQSGATTGALQYQNPDGQHFSFPMGNMYTPLEGDWHSTHDPRSGHQDPYAFLMFTSESSKTRFLANNEFDPDGNSAPIITVGDADHFVLVYNDITSPSSSRLIAQGNSKASSSVFTPRPNDSIVATLFKSSSQGDTGIDSYQNLMTSDTTIQGNFNTISQSNADLSASVSQSMGELSESISSSLSDLSSSISQSMGGLSGSIAQATFDAFAAQTTSSLGLPATPSGQGLFMGQDRLGFYSGSQWFSFISGSGQFRFAHTGSLEGAAPGTPSQFIEFTGDDFKIRTRNIIASGSNVAILTPSFLLGDGGSYISSSDDKIEISSSTFHLSSSGQLNISNDVTMSNNVRIEGGLEIGAFPSIPSDESLLVYYSFDGGNINENLGDISSSFMSLVNGGGGSAMDTFTDNGGGSYTMEHNTDDTDWQGANSVVSWPSHIGQKYLVEFNYTDSSGLAEDLQWFLGSGAVGSSHAYPHAKLVTEGFNSAIATITKNSSATKFSLQSNAGVGAFTISNIKVTRVSPVATEPLLDDSGYGITASITGNPTYQPLDSVSGNSLYFQSESLDKVDISDSQGKFDFGKDDEFSLNVWAKRFHPNTGSADSINADGGGNTTNIISKKQDGSNNYYGIDYNWGNSGAGIRAGIRNGTDGQYQVTYLPSDDMTGSFHHIVLTHTPNSTTGIKLYVDGELRAERTTVGLSEFRNTKAFEIGGNNTGGGSPSYFNGYLDELRIYSSSLSEGQVRALYLNPKSQGGTKISGDQITTGKIQSNNWNSSSVGSNIDLDGGRMELGGLAENAALYFDGESLKISSSITASTALVGRSGGQRLEYDGDSIFISSSRTFIGDAGTAFYSQSGAGLRISSSAFDLDSLANSGTGTFKLGDKLKWENGGLEVNGTITIANFGSDYGDAISGSFTDEANALNDSASAAAASSSNLYNTASNLIDSASSAAGSASLLTTSASQAAASSSLLNQLITPPGIAFGGMSNFHFKPRRGYNVGQIEISSPGDIIITTSSLVTRSLEYTNPQGQHFSYASESRGGLLKTDFETALDQAGMYYIMHTTKSIATRFDFECGTETNGNRLSQSCNFVLVKYHPIQSPGLANLQGIGIFEALADHNISSRPADSSSYFMPNETDTLVASVLASGSGHGVAIVGNLTTNTFETDNLSSSIGIVTGSVFHLSGTLGDVSGGLNATSTSLGDVQADIADLTISASTALLSSSLALPATPSGQGLFLGADRMGFYSGSRWYSYISGSGQFHFSSTSSLEDGTTTPKDFVEFEGDVFRIKTRNIVASGSSVNLLTPSFFLGSAENYISGSADNDGKIFIRTDDLIASGTNIQLQAQNFFMGDHANAYISGSLRGTDGFLELSGSGFHLQNDGEFTASTGKIAGWKISDTQIQSPESNPTIDLNSNLGRLIIDKNAKPKVEIGKLRASNELTDAFGMRIYDDSGDATPEVSDVLVDLTDKRMNIAGWAITSSKLYTGSNEHTSTFTGDSFIISGSGAIHAKRFYINSQGSSSLTGQLGCSDDYDRDEGTGECAEVTGGVDLNIDDQGSFRHEGVCFCKSFKEWNPEDHEDPPEPDPFETPFQWGGGSGGYEGGSSQSMAVGFNAGPDFGDLSNVEAIQADFSCSIQRGSMRGMGALAGAVVEQASVGTFQNNRVLMWDMSNDDDAAPPPPGETVLLMKFFTMSGSGHSIPETHRHWFSDGQFQDVNCWYSGSHGDEANLYIDERCLFTIMTVVSRIGGNQDAQPGNEIWTDRDILYGPMEHFYGTLDNPDCRGVQCKGYMHPRPQFPTGSGQINPGHNEDTWSSPLSGSDDENVSETIDPISSSAQLDGRECSCGNGIVVIGQMEEQQAASQWWKFDNSDITTGSINDCVEPNFEIRDHEGIFVNTKGDQIDGSNDVGYCYRYGDINMDHTINVLDIVQIVGTILDPSNDTLDDLNKFKLADINGDGEVNILDVVALVQYIVNQGGGG